MSAADFRFQWQRLSSSADAGGLVAAGVLLTVLFAWFHGIQWQQFTQARLTLGRYLEWCLPLLLAVLVTLSISLPGSSPAALAVMFA